MTRAALVRPGVWLLAALAYLPALTADPGRMPADTKLYLYLDPGRLIADAPISWDTRQFAGWVPHQTIAYLWPSGPWFWVFDKLAVPDWIAHRLWLGTLLFVGGAGVRWAARHLGLGPTAATVAGAVYATSPYILPYVSRTSVMLLPWAGVGWLVGLTIRAATRSGWRDPALFALVVLTIGAVNATALALVAPAPVLWLVHAGWQRSITWRSAWVTAARLGSLSLLVSLWWIVMLVVQGRHGADLLAFSETLDAVSLTSVSTETLRGLGYWLFYVRDPYAFTTTASIDYLGSVKVILIGYLLVVVCLSGVAFTRWAHRRYAALLILCGVVLAVGVHPIDDASPLMRPLRDSPLGLALRSSTRALPMSTFGMALGAGAVVAAMSATRIRWQRAVAPAVAPAVVLLAVVNMPALWTGGLVDPALVRDQDVPSAWTQAAAMLDAGSTEHRVLQLPGSEFGAFRWGYTVDPPLPGLTDKPLVTRDLLPLGSPGAMDLLYSLDNRFQNGSIEPDSIAAVARFLGVDTIWVANDLAFDRFRTPRPELVAELFANEPAGMSAPLPVGVPVPNVPDIAMVDEELLGEPSIGTPLAPVELVDVDDPVPVVRAATSVVEVAGSGDGIVDAAAAGLLTGHEAVIYSADLGRATVPERAVPGDSLLIVTDSNRDRAAQWRGSQDVNGFTETGGDQPDALRDNTADQRLAVFAEVDSIQQTVAVLAGDLVVRATAYGEPFAYRPEDRPSMAVDGEPSTAWTVADRADPIGEAISVSATDGMLTLLQPQDPSANRIITRIALTQEGSARRVVELTEASTTAPGQAVPVTAGSEVTITITEVAERPGGTDSGWSGVGFAELGPVAAETTRLPTEALSSIDAERPLAIVMTRQRVRPTDRWRSDPDATLVREFVLPVARSGTLTATLRLDRRAGDDVLAGVAGNTGVPTSNRRLTGVASAGAAAAVDGDPTTAWTTPFGSAIGSSITIPLAAGSAVSAPLGSVTLTQPVDNIHSRITAITVSFDGAEQTLDVPVPDAIGASTIDLSAMATDRAASDATTAPGASSLTLTIAGTDGATTIDRRFAEVVGLAAAISEITGLAIAAPIVAAVADCHEGLLLLDGAPVGLRFGTGAAAALTRGEAVDVDVCVDEPIALAPGTHRIESIAGSLTGVHVDQVTIRSGTTARSPTAVSPSVTVERTRTSRTATVAACPDGCWLILGEGYNPAWTAEVRDGADLGSPTQISGGFNGWWLEPSDRSRTISMRWSPQRGLEIALVLALLGVIGSIGLAVGSRRSPGAFAASPPPQWSTAPTVPLRTAAAVALALVVVTALVVDPITAVVAVVPAALMLALRQPRLVSWCAPALAGVLGVWVAWRQYSFRYPPDAAWTAHFEDLHAAGLFVVVLLFVGCALDDGPEPSEFSQVASGHEQHDG